VRHNDGYETGMADFTDGWRVGDCACVSHMLDDLDCVAAWLRRRRRWLDAVFGCSRNSVSHLSIEEWVEGRSGSWGWSFCRNAWSLGQLNRSTDCSDEDE
jgi:hypothetical protein